MTDEIIKCIVTVSDVDPATGEVGDSVTREQDLFTDNFGKLLAAWFKPQIDVTNPYVAGFTSISGVTESCYIYYSVHNTTKFNYNTGTSGAGMSLGVGTGSNSPTRADYNLQAQVGSWVGTMMSATWVSASGMLSFNSDLLMATEQVAASGTPITECGGVIDMYTGAGNNRKFMIMHDVFGGSPVDVRSGHYARVSYIIGV